MKYNICAFRNDNSPKFQSDQFEVILEKQTMPGQVIFKTRAVDPDGKQLNNCQILSGFLGVESNKLVYRLESQTYHHGKNKVNSNAFEVPDPTRGEIVLQKSIQDVGGIFELMLTASDLAEDLAHISRAIVKVPHLLIT
jgi:hypothetical protein